MNLRPLHAVLALTFLVAIGLSGFMPGSDFVILIMSFAVAGMVYLYAISRATNWQWWLIVGIAARIVLIPAFPNLSDDIYRFFWDGHLTLAGANPYTTSPAIALQTLPELPAFLKDIYPLLNSQGYYSVYPIVNQSIFALGAVLAGSDIGSFAIFLKVLLLFIECSSLWILFQILKEQQRQTGILIYALNPLVIIELSGNVHFEAFMIFFLLLMYYLFRRYKVIPAAVALALAIATKILPLLLAPFLLRRMQWQKYVLFATIAAVASALLFVPVFAGDASGFMSSLDLYFRRFEFNASIYNVARTAGIAYYGYNAIAIVGPAMAVCAALVLIVFWMREKRPSLENFPGIAVVVLSVYLLFATSVHPWYLCPLIAFCGLTKLRFPIAWSLIVFLTYAAYITSPPKEIWWVIGIEYVVVTGFMIWDYLRYRSLSEG